MTSDAYSARRSHWRMFAAVMLLVAAGVNLVWALDLFADAGWVPEMTLLAPGLWLQRLTTREPTLDQIEVSIRALREVLRLEGRITPDERRVEVMA